MRQTWILIAVGIAVFVAVVIATLPASLLVDRLPPELALEGISGTVWNGAADQFRLRGTPLGTVHWAAEPAALLVGKLAYRVELARADGYLRGRLAATFGGALEGDALDLKLPLTALHPQHRDDAWTGDLSGRIEHLRLEKGWPVALTGTFAVERLRPPGSRLEIGAYALDFDGRANTPAQLVGRVRDVAAPLVVRGQLEIRRDRSYRLQGEVTPRPDAAADVKGAVAFLGHPDAAGRRSFEITGTF